MTAPPGGEQARQDRIRRLAAARAATSSTKSEQALASVRRLAETGQPVTFTAIARHAQVSAWFLYNKPHVRAAIENAIAEQTMHGPALASHPPRSRVTPAALHNELAAARAEVRQLRIDRDRYRTRVQAALGNEIDELATDQLRRQAGADRQRIAELEAALRAAADRANAAEQHRDELQEELTAARASVLRLRSVSITVRGIRGSRRRSWSR